MKLGKYAAALVVTSFLLTGCNSSHTVKEDGKDVVASLSKGKKEKNIFADDIYADIVKTTSGRSAYFEALLQQLMDKKFPVDEAMEIDADQTIKQIQAYYENQFGENAETQMETVLAQSGYKSLEEYRNAMIRMYQKYNFLLDYVEKNFDEVFEDYYKQANPREVSIIKIAMADVKNPTEAETGKLNEVQALLASSKPFGDIATDYSDDIYTNKNKGNLGVVDTTSGLAQTFGPDVETKILALNPGEVSSPIAGTDGYYIVTVTSNDKKAIKKDLKKNLSIDTPLIAYDSYLQYIVFDSYKVEYSDKKTKKLVEDIVSDALAERESSRGGTE